MSGIVSHVAKVLGDTSVPSRAVAVGLTPPETTSSVTHHPVHHQPQPFMRGEIRHLQAASCRPYGPRELGRAAVRKSAG